MSKIKKRKEGQYEEKTIQVCVEGFDLNQEDQFKEVCRR